MFIPPCPTLETESLRVRPLEMSDAEQLFDLWSDQRVHAVCGIDGLQSVKSIQSGLAYFIGLNEAGFYHKWILELKHSGEMIGECELYPLRPQIRPWLEWAMGFSSKPEFWGRGLMMEAVAEVLDFAFTQTSAIRINADVLLDNERCKRFLIKNGFSLEGCQQQKIVSQGQLVDSSHFALLKSSFTARSKEGVEHLVGVG